MNGCEFRVFSSLLQAAARGSSGQGETLVQVQGAANEGAARWRMGLSLAVLLTLVRRS